VTGGEFRDDAGGGGADVVDVQFGLGQSGDEGVQIARDAGVDEMVGQGSSPERRPPSGSWPAGRGDRLIGDSGIIVGRAHGADARALA